MTLRSANWGRLALAGLAGLWISGCATHKAPPRQTPPAPPPQAEEAAPSEEAPAQTNSGPIPGSAQDFVINAGDRVFFDYDKADIRTDAIPVLTKQAAWLQRWPEVKVRIEGNADERGTREFNFALAAKRAEATRQFLVEHGIAAARITTISFGKEKPIDPGSDEQAWSRNRNTGTEIAEGAAGSP